LRWPWKRFYGTPHSLSVILGFMAPLEGIRVVDLSRLLPGPLCSWYLRGLGATVIKVEQPGAGDYIRGFPPFLSDGQGAWYAALNAGKQSVALDLKKQAHKDALRALLKEADVLIESFRPGVMARLGLDPEGLRIDFPKLIICSITGYGQTGPMRDQPGHDLGYMALSGALSIGARTDGVPDVPGTQVADVAGGSLTAGLRICAALVARGTSGEGDWLDVSMTDGVMALSVTTVAAAAASGALPVPGGELLTGGSPQYRCYRCRDGGMLAVAALEPKFWSLLCESVGRELSPNEGELKLLFATRDRDEWGEMLGAACCAPVLELDELVTHDHHIERKSITGDGENLRVSQPFPGGHKTARMAAPRLGEHTQSVLAAVGFDWNKLEGEEL
jgi:alpha-methylacyl-CoA racemase